MPVIPGLGRLRQEDYKFKVSPPYIARNKKTQGMSKPHITK
jgi:hypothetical protein